MLYQAGASSRGRAFAARHAEGVFVNAYSADVVAQYVDDTRKQAKDHGRDPHSLKFFSLMTPIVADTDEAAEQKLHEYAQCASDDGSLVLYGGWSGLDLAQYRRDEPLQYVENNAIQSAVHTFTRADPNREWTPEDIARHIGIGGMGPVFVGSPTTVADRIEQWVDESGVDGFNIAYAVTPGTFQDFVDLVVPELRRRGRVRHSYAGTTLRENLQGAGARLPADHPGAAHRR